MEDTTDKHWAQRALIDPLTEPEPNAETGPGASFRPDSETASVISGGPKRASSKLQKGRSSRTPSTASKNPFITVSESTPSKNPFISAKEVKSKDAYPSPPQSASPRKSEFGSSKAATGGASGSRRRATSLNERYPGDSSHRPLNVIQKHATVAHRAPHLRKQHQIRPDPIDQLDEIGGQYHHEGPFDSVYAARNSSFRNSPLEALAHSNEETIKATPREKIIDSVERHRPLDGVATYRPGEMDANGHTYNYEAGEDMMLYGNPEGGAFKRWPGIPYHPNDLKGKGEPSYTVEEALKAPGTSSHRRGASNNAIEMTTRRPRSSGGEAHSLLSKSDRDGLGRSNTVDRRHGRHPSQTMAEKANDQDAPSSTGSGGGGLKKRFGSIRRSLGGKKDF